MTRTGDTTILASCGAFVKLTLRACERARAAASGPMARGEPKTAARQRAGPRGKLLDRR